MYTERKVRRNSDSFITRTYLRDSNYRLSDFIILKTDEKTVDLKKEDITAKTEISSFLVFTYPKDKQDRPECEDPTNARSDLPRYGRICDLRQAL